MTNEEKEKLTNFLWELTVAIENSSYLPEDWIKERIRDINELFKSGQDCG